MIPSNGVVCGADNSSTIISQSTFVVDIPGNKKFTRAMCLRDLRHRCNMQWGSCTSAWHVYVASFQQFFQDYTVCTASINESKNSIPFSLDTLEVLPRNMYMDGMQFIALLCGQPLHYSCFSLP